MKLEVEEKMCVSLTNEINILKFHLNRVEEERRTEGKNLEKMIVERIVKVREEDLRSKENSIAEVRESSLIEQHALKEKILSLENSLLETEREAGVARTYVQPYTALSHSSSLQSFSLLAYCMILFSVCT